MESRTRVSLSAAQVTSSTSEGYPHDQPSEFMVSQQTLPGFLPIRAPLSLDSDFDIYVRSDDNVISTSGSESGRNMSEEDEFEFETASERPFVGFPDEETSVGSDDVEEYVLASPFLAVPDEETLEAPLEDEQNDAIGHYALTFVPVVVDDSNSKYSMPTARLSMDDDCDNGSGEEELSEVEDSGFSGAGRITGIRVLEEIDNVPKFKVLGIEEDDLQPRIKVNPDVFNGVGNEVLGSEKAKSLVEQSVDDLVEHRDFDNTEEAISEASAVNREDIAEETLKLNENVKCPSTESQVLRKLDNQETGLKGRDVGEQSSSEFNNNDAVYVKLVGSPVDVKEPTEVVEESLIMVDSADVVEEYGDFKSDESMGNSTGKNEIESVNRTKISILNPSHETKYLGNGDLPGATEDVMLEDQIYGKSSNSVSRIPSSYLDPDFEVNDVANNVSEDVEGEGTISDGDAGGLVFRSSDTSEQIVNEEKQSLAPTSGSGAQSPQHHLQTTEGQTLKDSEEKLDEDGDDEDHKIFDSEVLTSLLKAATSAGLDGDSGNVVFTSVDDSRVFSLKRHAGLGSSLRPVPQSNGLNISASSDLMAGAESKDSISEEEKKKLEKIQLLRVRFLRLVQRLGHSPEDSIVSQVLYQLAIDAGKHSNEAFSLESAKGMAMKLEAEGKGDIEFSLNILVLGKTGVGKSATINSIFCEEKAMTNAFEPTTSAVNEIIGTIDGVKIRVLDTPGLRSSLMEQAFNRKILSSIKKFMKKFPPDVVLYVDRLDTEDKDLNDLPLLKSITSSLGSSIWRNAIVTLTHGASSPPDKPSGSPLSYDLFVSQRSHSVQQSISQTVGDLRLMNPNLINPVSLVENHPLCRKNGNGQKVLPNGQEWLNQLLLLCCSMKTLSDASSLLKPQDPFGQRKLFGFPLHSPPLPYLLSSLLQSFTHPKPSTDQGGENVDSDIELGNMTDTDEENDDVYDQLPAFKPLRRSDIAKLSKEQRKAYFEEYDYRVKLLRKKEWRQELKRLREMKKKCKDGGNDNVHVGEDGDQESGSPATVPVPLPDMVLPPSFDADNPAYRYRSLDAMSRHLARPVLITRCWDHDCGYDGVSLEENLAIAGMFPTEISVQVTKGKNEFNIHFDSSVSAKHGENGSTMAGFNIQTIGRQVAYILRGETKIKNFQMNKTAAGVSITFSGKNVAAGLKIEDQIAVGRRLVFVGSTGAIRSQNDAAYGANFEIRLKENDFPIGQDQATLGLSLMKWRNDFALMGNLQCHFSVGQSSKMAFHVGLNNKLSGQITVRTSSLEQLQIALMGFLPIAITIFRSLCPGSGQKTSMY